MAKKKQTKKGKAAATLPFEQSLDQLKQVVSELETGNLSLSESLDKYQQGITNLQQCHAALENAKKQIEVLVDLDADGNLQTHAFDDTASSQSAHGIRRSTAMKNQTSEIDDFEPEDDYEEDDDENDDIEDGLF